MTSHTIVRSYSAIAVGCIFTAITAYVLSEDIFRHGAPVTTKHVMAMAVLGGTVFFGHRLWSEVKNWRLGNAFGCAALFLGGTVFCVLSSAGRNAEVVTNKALTANAANVGRGLAKRDMDEAKGRYDVALDAEIRECKTGEGYACRAARINSMVRRQQYDEAQAKLASQKPEQVANSDIRAAAELLSRLPLVRSDVPTLEATLLLAFPFLQSLFCEIAAICGFAMGLTHTRRQEVQFPAPVAFLPAPATAYRKPEIVARKARTPDEQLVLDALFAAGRALSSEELAEAMKVSPGESSKRRQVCEASGVVRTERVGKYLMISPAVAA